MSDWIKIGCVDDIPKQGARVVTTDSRGDIAIFRTVSETIYAMADSCPHKGGPLSQGIVHGEKITCPLHGRTFELATGETTGPDELCAERYPVKVEDGDIYLSLFLTVDDGG